jgi:hypothetical protein
MYHPDCHDLSARGNLYHDGHGSRLSFRSAARPVNPGAPQSCFGMVVYWDAPLYFGQDVCSTGPEMSCQRVPSYKKKMIELW